MSTPADAAGGRLPRAYLLIEQPSTGSTTDRLIPLKFNPTEYQLQKQNTFAEIGIPGLESPPIQFIRGGSEKLTAELLVDTSDTLDDVRDRYVTRLRSLMNLNVELHAPPIVLLVWDTQIFRGVLESLGVTYTLFRPDGVPLRAKLAVSLKEYRPADVQKRERPTSSPDFEKSYLAQRGDTLSGIAYKVYRDPTQWRAIATANDIRDPRRLPVGRTLDLPRLN
jgi:hypothetical protein